MQRFLAFSLVLVGTQACRHSATSSKPAQQEDAGHTAVKNGAQDGPVQAKAGRGEYNFSGGGESTITFVARDGKKEHHGSFRAFHGTIAVAPEHVTQASVD